MWTSPLPHTKLLRYDCACESRRQCVYARRECHRHVVYCPVMQECAKQFDSKDPEASAKCVRLIAAREKEIGTSATEVGGVGRYTMDVASVIINGGAFHSPTTCMCVCSVIGKAISRQLSSSASYHARQFCDV